MISSTTAIRADDVIAALRDHRAELEQSGVRHLSLFGSVARGEAHGDSDVDLAAELDPAAGIGLFALSAIERRISEWLGCRVELLVEPIRKGELRANVDRDRLRAF